MPGHGDAIRSGGPELFPDKSAWFLIYVYAQHYDTKIAHFSLPAMAMV
jgi:hypothetical protein